MIKQAKEENNIAIRQLERQIDKVDKEIEMTKKAVQSKTDIIQRGFQSNKPDSSMDCKLCEKSFNKFVDLEIHIKMFHEKHSILKCDQCDKGFVLRWRLKKHMRLHTESNIKHCHYFNNDKDCPYEEIGCKFLHYVSKNCVYDSKCTRRLCPYRHTGRKSTQSDTIEKIETDETSDLDDNSAIDFDSVVTSTSQMIFLSV